jgi:hypothetical protein
LFDFQVNDLGVGEPGDQGRPSFLVADKSQPLTIRVKAAAMLAEDPDAHDIRSRELDSQPYWHVERARHENTRQVPVELIVNGEAVQRELIEADGRVVDLEFQYTPERSSWVAIRVFPAAHTNPVFVEVDGAPIRPSKRSAQWCLAAVDRCWESKMPQIRERELADARAAYDHAREVYGQILSEAYDDLERN